MYLVKEVSEIKRQLLLMQDKKEKLLGLIETLEKTIEAKCLCGKSRIH